MAYYNSEGLTFIEWLAAAGELGAEPRGDERRKLERAWLAGEDPTEHRKEREDPHE